MAVLGYLDSPRADLKVRDFGRHPERRGRRPSGPGRVELIALRLAVGAAAAGGAAQVRQHAGLSGHSRRTPDGRREICGAAAATAPVLPGAGDALVLADLLDAAWSAWTAGNPDGGHARVCINV